MIQVKTEYEALRTLIAACELYLSEIGRPAGVGSVSRIRAARQVLEDTLKMVTELVYGVDLPE